MSSAVMPRAKERPRRTRTKRVSFLPPIVVSKLRPHNIDLFPGTESLVCPDCLTWCPITGQRGPTSKLVPHHTGKSEVGAAIRCRSSNRRVTFDLTVGEWNRALAEAHKETLSRRPSTVLRKPKPAVTPAVVQIAAQSTAAAEQLDLLRLISRLERARHAVFQHRARCAMCRGGSARCATGRALEVRLGETQATCTLAREQADRQERSTARAQTPPAARKAQWAKHNKAVEETNTRRTELPAGDTPLGAPPVPLQPLRPQRRVS